MTGNAEAGGKIVQIKRAERQQVVPDDFIEGLEEIVALCRSGGITSVVVVANRADEQCYWRHAYFNNAWSLLGALEYAKDAVMRGMGRDG